MRPSIIRHSDMPGPQHAWSKWWGDVHGAGMKQRGIVQYALAPNQAKVAPKMIRTYVFNFYRRVSAEAIYFVIPFAIAYGTYTWGNARYAHINSKAGHLEAGEHH